MPLIGGGRARRGDVLNSRTGGQTKNAAGRRLGWIVGIMAIWATFQFLPHAYIGWDWFKHRGGFTLPQVMFLTFNLIADLLFAWLLFGFCRLKLASIATTIVDAEPTSTGSPPPTITVLIPSCDEPLQVLEQTFAAVAEVDYPSFHVLVAENSTCAAHQRRVQTLAERYGLRVMRMRNRGTKAAALNEALPHVEGEFLLVLDADVVVAPQILHELGPILSAGEDIAFVQCPQKDRNRDFSWVATAASCQQAYFYEHVAEGMSVRGKALSVGTNCLFRVDAVCAVGGWPEATVTEDVAISWRLHRAGYRSVYHNHVLGLGLAPTSLGGLGRQRARHAAGAIVLLREVIGDIGAGRCHAREAFEYLHLMSFPLVALSYLMFLLSMVIVHMLGAPTWTLIGVHLAAALALVLTQFILMYGMRRRGYRFLELLSGQAATLLMLPAYLLGVWRALARGRQRFKITPKQLIGSGAGPWDTLALVAILMTGAAVSLLAVQRWNDTGGILVFSGWMMLHLAIFCAPFIELHCCRPARRAINLTSPAQRDG